MNALIVLLILFLTGCSEQQTPPADTLFKGGVIYTADATQFVASAIAIRDDRVVYIGSDESAAGFIGPNTEVTELQGKMIIPGLHDVHVHLPGIVQTDSCDLASLPFSLEELVPRLKTCTADIPPGEWLLVNQWSFTWGNEPSQRLPTLRAALDAVSTEHPIVLLGNDGHHGAANSYALRLATDKNGVQIGLSAATLANQFAKYRELVATDASGEPSGGLNEDARKLVNVPNLWGYPEIDLSLYQRIGQRLASLGITSVLDAALTTKEIDSFATMAQQSPLTWRMTAAFFAEFEDYRPQPDQAIDVDKLVTDLQAVQKKYHHIENLKIDTAKVFVDGVIEGDPYSNPPTLPNAAVLNHYLQPQFSTDADTGRVSVTGYVDPDSSDCAAPQTNIPAAHCVKSKGILEKEQAFIHNYTLALYAAGINVHSHAIGDRAVRVALDAFEAAQIASPDSQATVAIAHAQLVHPDDIERFAALNVFPAFTYAWIEPDIDYLMTVSPFIDPIMSEDDLFNPNGYAYQNSYPVASILAAGGKPTAGSDAPVDTRDPRPFFNLEKAVTRHNDRTGHIYNPEQRISVRDALDAYTINGAMALRQDHLTGSLEVGKKADFVILNHDLLALETEGNTTEISETQVIATWFDGHEIYRAD